MKKVLALLGLASTLLVSSLSAQSFAFIGEVDQLIDSLGSPVKADAADGFYAITATGSGPVFADPLAPTPEEVSAAIGGYSWLPLLDGTPAGGDWMTPNAELGQLVGIGLGEQPLFAFFDSVSSPTEVAIIAGAGFSSTLDNRYITISSGNYSILAGQAGSLQMSAVVPEPSTYALLGGVFALGFVMWRRRR